MGGFVDLFGRDLKLVLDEGFESGPDVGRGPRTHIEDGAGAGHGLRREIRCRLRAGREGRVCEDEMVEVTDGRDLRALMVGEVDGEGLFCAEDDFYNVEAIEKEWVH